ncbi:MAG: L,D-transpeptidase family protein [Oscillospiraceae bacterium]
MQSKARALTVTVLVSALILLCVIPSLAADFPDLDGHWAREAVLSAAQDGFLSGFEDGTVRPDSPVTTAEAAALLCRVLDAQASSDVTALGLTGDEWYAEAAGKALRLKLVSPGDDLTAPITRIRAFVMAAEAFQLAGSNESTASLAVFPASASLPDGEKHAVAALINAGLVQGCGGSLNLDAGMTRAEFITLLYRIMGTGKILTDGTVSGFEGGTLWLDCAAEDIRLSRVSAERVIVRSQKAGTVSLAGCHIGELVLAVEGDIRLSPRGLEKLRIGSGSGGISVNGRLDTLDLTGSGKEVALSENVNSIDISGNGNTVTISSGARIKRITVTGKNNTVAIQGTADSIHVLGEATAITGYGHIANVYLRAPGCEITEKAKNVMDDTDYGLYGVTAELAHPERLPAGETLSVAAKLIGAPTGLNCRESWYIDGELISEQNVTLEGGDVFTLNYNYDYKRGMALRSEIVFCLDYTTAYGYATSVITKAAQQLENYDEEHFSAVETQHVLDLITSDYIGDFTLAWAEQHDYGDNEKELWVNAKGYESDTPYLIWVNQAYQHVNIFEGTAGNWKLTRVCIVGCGRGNNTPKGVFKTTYKQPGWYTASYEVRPVVRFKDGGYAFHSRLYVPGSDTELMDPGIGYPISAGCIRMYDEDIRWIYDTVPSGTTVVVF